MDEFRSRGVRSLVATHEREFGQSNNFWRLTLDALGEAALGRLCRVYDQHSAGLNLVNLLETIKANLHLFTEPHFRKRLAGNAFVDSLARYKLVPDAAKLDKDIESASCKNPAVKKLMIWRNNMVAHKGAKVALGKDRVIKDNPLTHAEVAQLLEHSLNTQRHVVNLLILRVRISQARAPPRPQAGRAKSSPYHVSYFISYHFRS